MCRPGAYNEGWVAQAHQQLSNQQAAFDQLISMARCRTVLLFHASVADVRRFCEVCFASRFKGGLVTSLTARPGLLAGAVQVTVA